jgi:hypothetical protein
VRTPHYYRGLAGLSVAIFGQRIGTGILTTLMAENANPPATGGLRSAVEPPISGTPVRLDTHRGMAAQKATDLRRLQAEVEANEKALRERHEELQAHLVASPAANWDEAAEKARYLITLLAGGAADQDPRVRALIAAVFDDFATLSTHNPDRR